MARAPKASKNKEKARTRQKGGRGKPRPLRGEKLVQTAHVVLAEWANSSPQTNPINVSTLAKELNVTRQAIYNNKLDVEIDKYRKLQHRNYELKSKSEAVRKPLEEQVTALEEKIEDLERKLDGWIERWAAVEYNVKMYGIDADKIFAPMPPPDRKRVGFGRGRRGEDDDE